MLVELLVGMVVMENPVDCLVAEVMPRMRRPVQCALQEVGYAVLISG